VTDLLFLIPLFLASVAAGAVNTLAGGGTLLTFPSLMRFGGLSAQLANATNTTGVVPGSLAGAWGFRQELKGTGPWLSLLLPPSLLGGIVGSLLVVLADQSYFDALVPWLLLVASLLFLFQPQIARLLPAQQHNVMPGPRLCAAIVVFQFFVAVYGGYFGAGIGVLMLSALALMGLGDIHRMNAVKNLLAALINGISVVVFAWGNLIHWPLALLVAVGALLGGLLAARIGRHLPRPWVRWFVIAVGLGLSAYYFARRAGFV
jgi:uncharacterized membrane protein YfcA